MEHLGIGRAVLGGISMGAGVALSLALRERQDSYLARSRPVTLDEVRQWSVPRRLWNNLLAIAGPVL